MTETASSTLALHAGQQDWTDEQRAQLRRSPGAERATDDDLRLFFHHVVGTGLDPFSGQIYLLGRRVTRKFRVTNPETNNTRIEDREVEEFTTQVGIDGWRAIGNRAARREGLTVGHEDALWRGKDDGWQDYWDSEDGLPVACKYTLTVGGVRISATCSFAEYVQMVSDGQGGWVIKPMWRKMAANQIAKCAEALALRKAFPSDFSGLVLEDAAQAPDVVDANATTATAASAPEPTKTAPPRKAGGAARNSQRAARAAANG